MSEAEEYQNAQRANEDFFVNQNLSEEIQSMLQEKMSEVNPDLTDINRFLRIKALQSEIQKWAEKKLMGTDDLKVLKLFRFGTTDHSVQFCPAKFQLGNFFYKCLEKYVDILRQIANPATQPDDFFGKLDFLLLLEVARRLVRCIEETDEGAALRQKLEDSPANFFETEGSIRHKFDELPIGNGIARFKKILEKSPPEKEIERWDSFLGKMQNESDDYYIFGDPAQTEGSRLTTEDKVEYRRRNMFNIFREFNKLRSETEMTPNGIETAGMAIANWMKKYENSEWYLFVITPEKKFKEV